MPGSIDRAPLAADPIADLWRFPRRRSPGQAIVEFALILPVFLLLTIGVVDMARIFTSYIALTNGVANAALYASQGGFTKWCSGVSGDVACPSPTPPDSPFKPANPDNIAYQIRVESTGFTISDIHLATPMCIPVGSPEPAPVACTSTDPGVYAKVRIAATYDVPLLTPLMSTIMGGPVHMTASTTAVIY